VLNLTKNRNGASAVNNDEAGEIQFNGVNDAGTPETIAYAQILSSSAIVTDGDERGKLELKVANDGTLRNGITFLGTDTAQEVDVTIANGAASLTTIAGDLQINGNDIKASALAACSASCCKFSTYPIYLTIPILLSPAFFCNIAISYWCCIFAYSFSSSCCSFTPSFSLRNFKSVMSASLSSFLALAAST